MTVLTSSPRDLIELRADRASDPPRATPRDDRDAVGEFGAVLSRLDSRASAAREPVGSSPGGELTPGSRERRGSDDMAAGETSAPADSASNPCLTAADPNWAPLLSCRLENFAAAPQSNAAPADAKRSPESNLPHIGDGVDAAEPASLAEALAAAAAGADKAAGSRAPTLANGGAGTQAPFAPEDGRAAPAEGTAPAQASAADDEESSDGAPETISGVRIHSLEAHLPTALGDILSAQARRNFDVGEEKPRGVTLDIAPASTPLDAARPGPGPTKLLTIELEPESLGAVTVKMKLSRGGIDMHIRVESMEALRALDATRDKLVDAMQSSGCAVDSCKIQVGSTTPSADSSSTTANDGGQWQGRDGSQTGRHEHVGREGQHHGGQSGYPGEDRARGAEETQNGAAPRAAADRAGGLYL